MEEEDSSIISSPSNALKLRKTKNMTTVRTTIFQAQHLRNCINVFVCRRHRARIFGVPAQSMQCTYDDRGNSVPTILLMMQKRLYSEGGLQEEGIFRKNAECSEEERVRDRLINKGVVPQGADVHCLARLIKAWYSELPAGILDSITLEQFEQCNTEEDYMKLVKLLPPTEASLLDWAINLMADVVEQEQYNKMNARNIAIVFAPNMTQMEDPTTASIHVSHVINFLETLILKTLQEREGSPNKSQMLSSSSKNFFENETNISYSKPNKGEAIEKSSDTSTLDSLESNIDEKSSPKCDEEDDSNSRLDDNGTPEVCVIRESKCREGYESGDCIRFRKGVRKLCRHPIKFQLNKLAKKTTTLGIVTTNTREQGGEALA